MAYSDPSELSDACFGEVLAREVLKVVPDSELYRLTRTAVRSEGLDLDLQRLVDVCKLVAPSAIKMAVRKLRDTNDAYRRPCDVTAIDLGDLVDHVYHEVIERLDDERDQD